MERSTAPGEAGYTLVAIMVFMACLLIALTAVSPLVSKIMERERETELIFRGRQYALYLQAYQRRTGHFPTSLKDLMKTNPRSARKLWTDPMCDCSDWGLIPAGMAWPPLGPSGASGPSGAEQPPGTNPTVPGTYSFPPQQGGPTGAAGFSNDQMFQDQGPQGSGGPIWGVYSKVHRKGIRTYKGYDYYDQWGFIAGQNNSDDLIPGLYNQGGRVIGGVGIPAPPPRH